MKILLIGRNGQLGQEIEKEASKFGYTLIAFSKEELDITNYSAVRTMIEAHKPDIVINTSAQHATLDSEVNPQNPFAINSFALKSLAVLCKEKNICLVTYSSDYVFDGLKGTPYGEKDKQNPVQLFGLSKYMGELIAINYNPDTMLIRTCGVYGGIQGSRSKKNFVLNILDESKDKKVIDVSYEQVVSPTYAYDLAIGTLKLLEKTREGGMYHLVNTGYCSWAEFSEEIMKLRNLKVKINPVNRNGLSGGMRRPLFSALKNTRAKKIGITLPTWQDGLKRYMDFLTEKYE